MAENGTSKQMALIKLKDAIEAISGAGETCNVVFAPDIIRDVGISESEGKDLVVDLSGLRKDRLSGFPTFVRGGGHALLGANAAMAMRGSEQAVRISMLAKVLQKDYHDLVEDYLVSNPGERGIAPADISLVLQDKGKRQAANVVLARKESTTILLGDQPKLRVWDYELEDKLKEMTERLESAQVIAMLSLKSPFMSDMLDQISWGRLHLEGDLLCDCTSGDDMEANYRMLDIMKMKDPSGASPIRMLSINEFEVTLFELLLRREAERKDIIDIGKKKAELVKQLDKLVKGGAGDEARKRITDGISGLESSLLAGRMGDAFGAAKVLSEKTGMTLLMHTKEGACVIGKGGASGFIPSPMIDFPKGASFVGAGDTLCGGMALAVGVKKKSDALLPSEKRLTDEDCLLLATLATSYRLAKINHVSSDDKAEREWYEAVGKIEDIYAWANWVRMRASTEKPLPAGIKFIDVEKNSEAFGPLTCLDEKQLLSSITRHSAEKGAIARAAFEELTVRRSPESLIALAALVSDGGEAGGLFGLRAARVLSGRGGSGIGALRQAAKYVDGKMALEIARIVARSGEKMAAQAVFDLFCNFRILDAFDGGPDNASLQFIRELAGISCKAPFAFSRMHAAELNWETMPYAELRNEFQNFGGRMFWKEVDERFIHPLRHVALEAFHWKDSSAAWSDKWDLSASGAALPKDLAPFVETLLEKQIRDPAEFLEAITKEGFKKEDCDRYLISKASECGRAKVEKGDLRHVGQGEGDWFERPVRYNIAEPYYSEKFVQIMELLAPPCTEEVKDFLMEFVRANGLGVYVTNPRPELYDFSILAGPLPAASRAMCRNFKSDPEVMEFLGSIIGTCMSWALLDAGGAGIIRGNAKPKTGGAWMILASSIRQSIMACWPELLMNKRPIRIEEASKYASTAASGPQRLPKARLC